VAMPPRPTVVAVPASADTMTDRLEMLTGFLAFGWSAGDRRAEPCGTGPKELRTVRAVRVPAGRPPTIYVHDNAQTR
jgi:hypothetical protein